MLKKICMAPPCRNMYVKSRHHCPVSVSGPKLEPKRCVSSPLNSSDPLANTIARNTARFAPNKTCVSVIEDSLRTHGCRMTGCGMFSMSSPRCAASCCTHHWQIFLNVNGGICRPHRIQFAMLIQEYQQWSELWKGQQAKQMDDELL